MSAKGWRRVGERHRSTFVECDAGSARSGVTIRKDNLLWMLLPQRMQCSRNRYNTTAWSHTPR